MNRLIIKSCILPVLILGSLCAMGQEGDKKFNKTDSTVVDTTVTKKGQMPVTRPDDKKPVSPMPNKDVKNNDGMPVYNPNDSTMNKPKR